jgi:hypothetical protein
MLSAVAAQAQTVRPLHTLDWRVLLVARPKLKVKIVVADELERGDPHYALGKFSLAVYELATNPYEIQYRLKNAALKLAPVFPDDIPQNLKAEFHDLKTMLHRRRRDGTRISILSYRAKTAVGIAKLICNFEDKLEAATR